MQKVKIIYQTGPRQNKVASVSKPIADLLIKHGAAIQYTPRKAKP